MREISLYRDNKALPTDTTLIYGDTGSGKTTWSAGSPRPLVFAETSEEGWKSLEGLTDDQLFEPDVDPIVWGVSAMNDMSICIEKAQPLIASGRVKTIVISSITFYADLYLSHLVKIYPGDARKQYGDLGVHLREIRNRIHNLGASVIWEALAQRPDSESGLPGSPLIPGKQADKFAAGVTYLMHSFVEESKSEGKTVRKFKMHTEPTGGYLARTRMGRGGPQIPNPFCGTYSHMLAVRGFDVEALRKSLVPIKSIAKVSSATVTQPPPVTKVATAAPKPSTPTKATPTVAPSANSATTAVNNK